MSEDAGGHVTLGDKLQSQNKIHLSELFVVFSTSTIIGVLSWWASQSLVLGIIALVICALFFVAFLFAKGKEEHFLFCADRNRFMKSLKLADKTAIFDGSNIYHFGLKHGVGVAALKTLIQNLRADGYRIICFFDANIFFTLRKNNEFQESSERFLAIILRSLFGLNANEIYVVPSGIQADRFIVESLSHLPISFAVTNDRYRDFETEYDFLNKDKSWRKGVRIEQGKLLLYQYNFKPPLKV